MALNNADTAEFISTVLNSSTFPIMRANQSIKSPPKEYATYIYTGNPVIGAAPITYHGEGATTMTENIANNRTSNLEVQFFTLTEQQALAKGLTDHETANDLAQRFEDSLKSDRVKRYMRSKGFSVLSTTPTYNLDKMLGDMWERRAAVELVIHNITIETNEVEFFTPPITVTITPEDI